MMKLWIDVVGGENSPKYNDERIVARGNLADICKAVHKYADEVESDTDKYFELETDDDDIVFNTVEEFESLILD